MQFAVNGNEYFLRFVPEEDEWFVFSSTDRGFFRLPVVHDDQGPIPNAVILVSKDEDHQKVN